MIKSWNRLERICLAAFLAWGAVGFLFTVRHISEADVNLWPIPAPLAEFVNGCLSNGDPVLILLAFANTHLLAARQWTASVARRWAAIVCVAALGIETFGAWSGFPFGVYHYTDRFGPLLGLVPLTIPLAWHVVVTNAIFVVRACGPHLTPTPLALLAGLVCTAYDGILEPFATTVKGFWIWAGDHAPAQNYVAWFVVSALLVRLFAPNYELRGRDPRPWLILGLTSAIFLAAW